MDRLSDRAAESVGRLFQRTEAVFRSEWRDAERGPRGG
jgi:hypothetical protein